MSAPPIKEITAFHPGEKEGSPVYANPMDNWSDASFYKPDPGKLVMAWTGRFMCQVVYDYSRKMWVTKKGHMLRS